MKIITPAVKRSTEAIYIPITSNGPRAPWRLILKKFKNSIRKFQKNQDKKS
jgi:hypothetical protein